MSKVIGRSRAFERTFKFEKNGKDCGNSKSSNYSVKLGQCIWCYIFNSLKGRLLFEWNV